MSQDFIDEGLKAIENDDWDKQKSIKKLLRNNLQNPQSFLPDGWYLETSSAAELNVQIAEEKAIQEAVYASIELNNLKNEVNSAIAEKTKDIQPLLGLNTTTLRYASTWEGMAEHQPLMNEIDKILQGNEDLKLQQDKINQLTSSLSEVLSEVSSFSNLDISIVKF